MTGRDGLRYALVGGVLATAVAQQKKTGLITSWIFHATINPALLLFPELYQALSRALSLEARAGRDPDAPISVAHGVISDVVVRNPRYVDLVGIVPLAYILSFPSISIYKSEWANKALFGWGLDSIPHAATAFSLIHFVRVTVAALKRHMPRTGALAAVAEQAVHHTDLVAAGALVMATAGYEGGEYLIHLSELRKVGGEESRVAMEWSVEDTLQDIISNCVGGVLALLQQRYSTTRSD